MRDDDDDDDDQDIKSQRATDTEGSEKWNNLENTTSNWFFLERNKEKKKNDKRTDESTSAGGFLEGVRRKVDFPFAISVFGGKNSYGEANSRIPGDTGEAPPRARMEWRLNS